LSALARSTSKGISGRSSSPTDAGDQQEPFNMALLAIRGCGAIKGVNRLHSAVSRRPHTIAERTPTVVPMILSAIATH
jgi:glucan phosphorylase